MCQPMGEKNIFDWSNFRMSKSTPQNTLTSKTILVLGSKGVGKTSLIFQHIKNGFVPKGTKDVVPLVSAPKEEPPKLETPPETMDTDLKLFTDIDVFKKELVTLLSCQNPTLEQKKQLKQYQWLYKQLSQIMFVRLPTEEEEDETSSNPPTNDEVDETDSRLGQTPPSIAPKLSQLYLSSQTVFSSPEISREASREAHSLPISPRDSLDSPDFKKEDSEVFAFKEGIDKFGISYKEGIHHLKNNGFVTEDNRTLARFLIKTGELDKAQFGALMGHKDSTIANAVAEYSIYYPFFEMGFEESLRNFLKLFILPVEGQQVARICDIFSDIYIKCKPGELEDDENAVLLTAAILMLNVSLHNAKVKPKDRISKATFCKILSSTRFSSDFLTNLYENIKNNEIKYNTIEKKSVTKFGIFKKTTSQQGVCKSCTMNSFREMVFKKSDPSCLVQLCIKDPCSKHLIGLEKQDWSVYDGFVILFSVSDMSSFEYAITLLNSQKKREKCVLVGTKSDDESRVVSREKGIHVAMEYGISFIETSVYKNINVDQVFQMVLDLMDSKHVFQLLENIPLVETLHEPVLLF
jgi:GTPase SAR1 family protein